MTAPAGSVLVAYDGSAAARRAVAEAAKLMASSRMLVVTVWEEGLSYTAPATTQLDGMQMGVPADAETALALDREFQRHAERVSLEGAELARSLGLEAEALGVRDDEGSISRAILRVAAESQAAAIVVGSRGLSGLRARLEGSTSKDVLKHARCPVLVVHELDEGD